MPDPSTAVLGLRDGRPRGAAVLDRAMGPVVRSLDADKMAKLGIRNTMRLGKAYNRLLYGRHERYRVKLHRNHFAELLEENGGLPAGGQVRMEDGFAIDESGSLPYLEELLEEADQVISERAGEGAVDDRYRAFFRNLIRVEELERWPSFLRFVTSSPLVATVADYLGFIPALSETLPAGVRLVESGKHLDALAHLPPRDSQLFHIDPYDHPIVYVIVLLRECTPKSGPFTFLPASVSAWVAAKLRYGSRGRPYRLSDEEVYSVVDPSERLELVGPKGKVLFVDTSRCFHYGARDGEIPRFQLMYGLGSPRRADFSQTYMPRGRHPVHGDEPHLRRLVLDREVCGL